MRKPACQMRIRASGIALWMSGCSAGGLINREPARAVHVARIRHPALDVRLHDRAIGAEIARDPGMVVQRDVFCLQQDLSALFDIALLLSPLIQLIESGIAVTAII